MLLQINLQATLKIVTLHTFFLSTLMSLGMLLSRRKSIKNYILFGLFLAFSMLIFYFFLFESGLLENHKYLSAVCILGTYLVGPMVYFLALYAIHKSFVFSKKYYWHLLPVIIAGCVGIACVYFFGYKSLNFYFNFYGNIPELIIGLLGDISFTIYLFVAAKLVIKNFLWHPKTLRNEPSALASLIIFDIFLAAAITDTLSLITGRYIYMQLSVLLVCVCIVLLFLLNLIYPNFENVIGEVVKKEIQKRSYLSNVDTQILKNKLDTLFHTQKIYTDEGLTLNKLASLASVYPHQLSEYINTRHQKNVITYINEFRIHRAKELLIEKQEYTILAIAYEVGFNSKSAFNEAFRKITGETPSQFKSNNS